MDRVFSDRFWSSPPPRAVATEAEESFKLNRSASEWSFRRFLQEASASDSSTSPPPPPASPSVADLTKNKESGENAKQILQKQSSRKIFGPPCVPPDYGDYQAFLKSKLNLACAAVALCRGSYMKAQVSCASSPLAKNESQAKASHLPSQPHSKGSGGMSRDNSRGARKLIQTVTDIKGKKKSQDNDINEPLGISSSPCVQTKAGILVSSTTVSSSIEQTNEEDDVEEDDAIEQMDPADAKRVKRMLSNRESARRSRKRKQAHFTELETQVAELRVENSALMKRFSDISQKYNEAAVNNRVLKADLETLKTKVQMAEETVRRITGSKKIFHAMSEVSSMSMQSFDRSPSEISTDAPNNYITDISSGNIQINSSATATLLGNKTARTASLRQVASLEHLQKHIRGSSGACDPSPSGKGDQQ